MPDTALTNSPIVARYRERTPGSATLAASAGTCFPSAITHDSRYLEPYAVYIDRALGAHKWDVDGHEYVDYFGGHGALILGHNHPAAQKAVHAQVDKGTHFGASHELEVRWAELVKELVPSAERLRFTSSGTEATLMALRLARAYTGRAKLVRFIGHFHGWHDHMTSGVANHFDGSPTVGVLKGVAEPVLLAHAGDEAGTRKLIEANAKDIAAVIIEPTGGSFGRMPLKPEFLTFLRKITQENGIQLIFDEVVSGFRVAPGGAQAHFKVTPDMTSLAKILAGGLPGGAVVGKKDLFDNLDFAAAKAKNGEKINHPGTFNANPLSAAAGIATLKIIKETDACARAAKYAVKLRKALNQVIADAGVPWAAYGTFGAWHLFTNPERKPIDPLTFDPFAQPESTYKSQWSPTIVHKIRLGMLIHGVDVSPSPGGPVSAVHSDADLNKTADAMKATLKMLKDEGEIRL
ncbi:MAG: aminotransferase class III-fold pyridoxal phosphate-dependent enzyme [Proteobacteria bacterium]|nr:aminotransferase class III-fold pyridoxal phosphate-dependent enzyme [Pseudomonadota bacterium]